MIRLDASHLEGAESYGLSVLIDLARLPPVDTDADVVCVTTDERPIGTSIRDDASAGWHIAIADGRVVIPRAVLRRVTDIAGAGEEQRSTQRDRYDRVPAEANPLVAAGLERQAVISRAARALRAAVIRAAGRRLVRLVAPWPDGCRWAAAFTHDLDAVRWWPLFTTLRVAELLRGGEWRLALQVGRAAARAIAGDPLWRGVDDVLGAESRGGIRGTWFVLCGTPTPRSVLRGDLSYRPESRAARRVFAAVSEQGSEVGLHGSFETMLDASRMAEQRARLNALVVGAANGIRQHFLRMRPGATQRAMEAAGFAYDATWGFADRNGFRLGVADVLPIWDDAGRRRSTVDAVALTWMDRALSKYRGVQQPSAWIADALELAQECRRVDGLWVGLWHPNLTPALGFPGAPAEYERLLSQIVAARPYVAPLRDIVRWRRARRSVRVRAMSADGRVIDLAGDALPAGVRLEAPSESDRAEAE